MRKFRNGIAPKSGYVFTNPDGAVIRATGGWRALIARVMSYRKRNKMPPGDPQAEVYAQACEREPANCYETEDPVNKAALTVASLKGRVLQWASALRGRQETLLYGDAENAAARAAVCLNCPAHATVAGGCGACKKAVKEQRKALLGPRPIDERLHGCSILGIDCAVAAWIDEPTVENPELPACCWRRSAPPA